jgi:phosphopantetheine adenylyltransferase
MTLTPRQLEAINRIREKAGMKPVTAEVAQILFDGLTEDEKAGMIERIGSSACILCGEKTCNGGCLH